MGYIDITIIILFLAATLFVGIRHGGKVKTMQDYALGNRNFSTTALTSTIVATVVSGSMFFNDLSNTYSQGLAYFIPSFSMSLQILILGFFIVPRMGEFLGTISVAEAMGNMYGEKVRLITAICGIAGTVGFIGVQFKVFGTLFHYFLGVPVDYAVILAASIVIFYSAFGGIRAVTYTDILQFFTFAFVLPVTGIIIWNKFHSMGLTFENATNNPLFDYKKVLSLENPGFWEMVFLFLYFIFPTIGPVDFQRIAMGKNVSQVYKAWIISSVIVGIITIFVAWIPFLIFNINSELNPNDLFGYIIENYAYTGFKGLIIIGIIAMAMSTADSCINAASVLFAHDISKLLKIKTNELIVSKVFALVLGIFSIYLAMSKSDLLSIVRTSASFYMPIVSVPFFLAICGFRTSKKAVITSMVGGFITVLSWKYLNTPIADNIIPGMSVNFILLMFVHYGFKQPGGWVGVKDRTHLNEMAAIRKRRRDRIIKYIKDFNIITFCLQNTPKDSQTYSFFGVFAFISTISTIYLTYDSQDLFKYSELILVIYQSMLIIAVFFLLYVMWSERIRNKIFIAVVWNISIVYILVICSTFFVLLSNLGKMQLVIFTLNFMVLSTLTRWQVSIVISIIGITIGAQMYKYWTAISFVDILNQTDSFSTLMYILILSATSIITFLKPKQEYLEFKEGEVSNLSEVNTGLTTENHHLSTENASLADYNSNLVQKNITLVDRIVDYSDKLKIQDNEISRLGQTAARILNAVNHELRLPIGSVLNFSEILKESLEKSSKKYLKELSEEIYNNSGRVSSMILNMLDLASINTKRIDLQKQTINLSELVQSRAKRCFRLYKEKKPLNFKLDIEDEILMQVDANYIKQAIDNLVTNAIEYTKEGEITVNLRKEEDSIEFSITDEGIGIPTNELHTIFEPFMVSSKTLSKARGRGVGLALCKAIIEAHGGTIFAYSDGIKGAKFSFSLPIK